MKHAGPDTLDALEPLMVELRSTPGMAERKRGVFYRKGSVFLHFHKDRSGTFADLEVEGSFERMRAGTRAEQSELRSRVRAVLEPREGAREKAPSGESRRWAR